MDKNESKLRGKGRGRGRGSVGRGRGVDEGTGGGRGRIVGGGRGVDNKEDVRVGKGYREGDGHKMHQNRVDEGRDAYGNGGCVTGYAQGGDELCEPPAQTRSEHQPEGKVRIVRDMGSAAGERTDEDLARTMESMIIQRPARGERFGTRNVGKINVTTNYFPLRIDPKIVVHMYNVVFKNLRSSSDEDIKISKGRARQLVKKAANEYESVFQKTIYLYNGTVYLYSTRKLCLTKTDPRTGASFQVLHLANERIDVTLTYVGQFLMGDVNRMMSGDTGGMHEQVIDAVNNMMREVYLARTELQEVGRNFYRIPDDPYSQHLGGFRTMWYGFKSSALPTRQKTLNINMDMTAATFFSKTNLVDFIRDILWLKVIDQKTHLTENRVKILRQQLNGMRIEYEYGTTTKVRRSRKLDTLSLAGANCETFEFEGKKITVAVYFHRVKKITLKYPCLPCCIFGNRGQRIRIPLEFCTLLEQRAGPGLTPQQTSKMLQKTAVQPHQRKRQIENEIRSCGFANNPYMREFGVELQPRMLPIEQLRVLPAPEIQYQDGKKIQPRGGSWNASNMKFYKHPTKRIDHWVIANFCVDTARGRLEALRRYQELLIQENRKLGLSIPQPRPMHEFVEPGDVEKLIDKLASEGCGLLMCVVPDRSTEISVYGHIKYYGNVKNGIVTSCVRSSRLTNKGIQNIVGNILKKVNAKLGGINHRPYDPFVMNGVMKEPTIIFGADVAHPSPGNRDMPSVAAVTASLDWDACKYAVRVRAQRHRREMITDLRQMTKDLLRTFFRQTQKKPKKIIFFRDGVGDSQYDEVLRTELTALRAACKDIEEGYRPGITLLLVIKRHHTRFFPQTREDGDGRRGNVPAGTVVDKGVTHPTDYDYFLASQEGIQGTTKPAHYYMLWDDNDLSPDDVEALTYYLCHCYSNCTKSVSNPAPAYYAHKAADLAMSHLRVKIDLQSDSGSASSGLEEPTEEMQNAISVHGSIKDSMYFL